MKDSGNFNLNRNISFTMVCGQQIFGPNVDKCLTLSNGRFEGIIRDDLTVICQSNFSQFVINIFRHSASYPFQ